MLIATLSVLSIAVLLGIWLSSMMLIYEHTPKQGGRVAAVHGLAGATAVILLCLTLLAPGAATRFAVTGLVVLGITLLGGLTILAFNLRRRPVSPVLIAMHACAGMAGAVILAAYFSTRHSFGY